MANPDDITLDHQLTAYGFTPKSGFASCQNRFSASKTRSEVLSEPKPNEDEDVIIISDDESSEATIVCSKKNCRGNPRCLNYMGQEVWENEGMPDWRMNIHAVY